MTIGQKINVAHEKRGVGLKEIALFLENKP